MPLLALLASLCSAQPAEVSVQTGHQFGNFVPILNLAFSGDDRRMVSYCRPDGRVILWDIQSGRQVRTFIPKRRSDDDTVAFDISSDGEWLAFSDYEGGYGVRVVDLSTGRDQGFFEVDADGACDWLALSHDGGRLACLDSGYLTVLDGRSGAQLSQWRHSYGDPFLGSPDLSWFLTRDYGDFRLARDGSQVAPLGPVFAPAFHPDNDRLFFVSRVDDELVLRSVSTGTQADLDVPDALSSIVDCPDAAVCDRLSAPGHLRISADGQNLTATFGEGFVNRSQRSTPLSPRVITTRSLEDGALLGTRTIELPYEAFAHYQGDGGSLFYEVSSLGTDLYSATTGKRVRRLTSYASLVRAHPTPTPHRLVVHTNSRAGVVDLSTGRFRLVGPAPMGPVTVLDHGDTLVADNVGGYEFWDYQTGKQTRRLAHSKLASRNKLEMRDNIDGMAFSPRGDLVMDSWYSDHLRLWDTQTGAVRGRFPDGGTIHDFSPDGTKVGVIRAGYQLDVVDLSTFATDWSHGLRPPANTGMIDRYTDVVFAADGTVWASRYASGSHIVHFDAAGAELTQFDAAAEHLTLSPDDGTLLSRTDRGFATWNTTTGDRQLSLSPHSGGIRTADFTADGRFIVTGGDDGETQFRDAKTGELIATMVIVLTNEARPSADVLEAPIEQWRLGEARTRTIAADMVLYTPDNYYTADRGALRGLAFQVGAEVFGFEQFDLRYNRPDIVLERLGYASDELIAALRAAYERRLRRHGFTEDMLSDDFAVPTLELTDKPPTETETGELTVSVHAEDARYALDRLQVYIDDVPVHGTAGIALEGDAKSVDRTLDISVPAGDHRVQVSALNRGGVESLRETFEIACTKEPPPSDLYVLAVGVSSYAQSEFDLKWAAKDAADVAAVFGGRKGGEVHTLVLTDADATRDAIGAGRAFLERAAVDDQVVVFLAGHGVVSDERDYYFATHDIDFADPAGRGLPYSDVEGLVDGLDALQKLVLMDTCHSGEIDKEEVELAKVATHVNARSFRGLGLVPKVGSSVANTTLLTETFADLRRGTGAVVLSSSSGSEFSYEDASWQNGVFSFALIEGLKQGKAGKRGEIRVSALQDYVAERVRTLTDGRQNPTMRRENLAVDFVVY